MIQALRFLIGELWKGWRDPNYILFQEVGVERYFARCVSCGRVFMHYWGCVTAADRALGRRIGCPCGGMKMRLSNLPQWQQGWFLLSRFIWRKAIKGERFWDPRMVVKVGDHGVTH